MERSDLHLGELERVTDFSESQPEDRFISLLVLTEEIKASQVRMVTIILRLIPPTASKLKGALVYSVLVQSAELLSKLQTKRITCIPHVASQCNAAEGDYII